MELRARWAEQAVNRRRYVNRRNGTGSHFALRELQECKIRESVGFARRLTAAAGSAAFAVLLRLLRAIVRLV
jgi:hypothetical protein